jgi:hypothetical protein
MTSHATLFDALNAQLQDIESALLAHQPEALALACQTLTDTLSSRLTHAPDSSDVLQMSQAESETLERRFKQLRQSLLQKSAANDRALAALLPEESLAGYGSKSAFGGARRSANWKSSYQV